MTHRNSVEHEAVVRAPHSLVLGLLEKVEDWPLLFPPTIHVEILERTPHSERIELWATAGDTVKHWTSRRDVDRAASRIDFRQEVTARPATEMHGAWIVEPTGPGESRVRLLHDYAATEREDLEYLDAIVDRNSRSELAALVRYAETAAGADGTVFSFEDSVEIAVASAEDAFAFIAESDRWPQRLPHVAAVDFAEPLPGVQVMAMETRAPDGSTHETKSHRVVFAPDRIHYKQAVTPALLAAHTGRWTVRPAGPGSIVVSSQHAVVLDPTAVAGVLGPDADVAAARDYVHHALSANSMATLRCAKDFAEQAGTSVLRAG